jgi:hypothetical protein
LPVPDIARGDLCDDGILGGRSAEMTELKPCPFCGENPTPHDNYKNNYKVCCVNPSCELWGEWITAAKWQNRPIEDALQSKITNALRMISGAKSSPDYPDNLPGLLDELREELER